MFKKKKFNKYIPTYNKHLYSGFIGKLMKKNHDLMEKNFILFNEGSEVLEIGAGTYPHVIHLKHKYKNYHISDIDNDDFLKEFYQKFNEEVIFKKTDGINFEYKKKTFDRIIISHCLEHVNYPDIFLDKIVNLLKDDGILSVSLPTDPGLLWRTGRFFIKRIFQKKTHNMDENDYEYTNAIEHVNSIFNLKIILKKKLTLLNEIHYPLSLPFPDLNIFYIADFKKLTKFK